MKSKEKILENLPHKRKFIGNVIALLAGFLLILTVFFGTALPGYVQITALLAKQREQAEYLANLIDFADKHVDYTAYENKKYQELARLQQSLWQLTDSNQAQNKLQRLAQKEHLMIKQLQSLSENKATIKIELIGNYFALLRWLQKVEKMPLAVQKIELKGQADGNICADLLLQGTFLSKK